MSNTDNKKNVVKGSGGTFNIDELKQNKEVLQTKIEENIKPKRKYNVKPKAEKSSIRLKVNKTSIEEFREFSDKFFDKNDALHEKSTANFLRVIMVNLDQLFKEKYNGVLELTENQLEFLKSPAKRIENVYNYPHISKDADNTSFTIEKKLIEYFYRLAFTFYTNERKFLYQYSLLFFFYDILSLLENKELDLVYYSKKEIDEYFELTP